MYNRMKDSVTDASRFRNLIKVKLTSPARTEIRRYQRKGRLDRRAHKRIDMCRGDVFMRKTFHEGEHVAVSLLLDGSGSMNNNGKAWMANVLAIHLCEAIEQAGSEVQVTGFYELQNGVASVAQGLSAKLVQYKKFDDRIGNPAVKEKLARFADSCTSGTRLSAAIKHEVPRLAARVATRHIMFVCCDGACDYGQHTAKAVVDYMRVLYPNVQIIGLGIMADASDTFGKASHVPVTDINRIASTGLEQVLTRLQGR